MAIKFTPNYEGFRELRTSAAADALAFAAAKRVEAEANSFPSTTRPAATEPYYETVRADDNSDRVRYWVRTTSARADRHDRKTNALTRSAGT